MSVILILHILLLLLNLLYPALADDVYVVLFKPRRVRYRESKLTHSMLFEPLSGPNMSFENLLNYVPTPNVPIVV